MIKQPKVTTVYERVQILLRAQKSQEIKLPLKTVRPTEHDLGKKNR